MQVDDGDIFNRGAAVQAYNSEDTLLANLNRERIFFTQLAQADRHKLVFDRVDHCEFHDDLMTDDETYFLYQINNVNSYTLLGAAICTFYNEDRIVTPITFCWVHVECTYANVTGLPTSGRLLWCYILKLCYMSRPYNHYRGLVFNHAIAEAVGYHLSMGMKPYNYSEVSSIFSVDYIAGLINHFTDGEGYSSDYLILSPQKTLDQLFASPETVYLFYVLDQTTDYSNIGIILNSIPTSLRGGTKEKKNKSKRKRKRKRNRNNKSKKKKCKE